MLSFGKPFYSDYFLGAHQLDWATEEKDLGVWVSSNLKSTRQCNAVYKRASNVLGMLKRIFSGFTVNTLPIVTKTYLMPSMEYAIQAWSPWFKKDSELLDKINHRAPKMVRELEHLSYNERMESVNMLGSNCRMIRADLILTYRILSNTHHTLR